MIALVAALLLAAPSAAAKPSAEWLTGLWVEQKKPGLESLDECASWSALFYRADSTFAEGQREGFWVLRGSRIYELDESPDTVPVDELLSSAEDSTEVVRLGPDRMRKRRPGGSSATFVRCPKPETPSAR